MGYKICIIDTTTWEERVQDMRDIPWGDASVFWWTEGNYGCDCNRAWEFARAGGLPEAEVVKIEQPCSHSNYSRYYVPWAEVDGKRIEIDPLREQARA